MQNQPESSLLRFQVRTLHRIVRTDPPSIRDFTSKLELGVVDPGADEETKRLESGLSTYRTLAQARRKARAFRFLGQYVAVIDVALAGSVTLERTTSSAGHYTVWGDGHLILGAVVTVERVEG